MRTKIVLFTLLLVQGVLYAQPQVKEISHYLFPEFAQGIVLMKNGQKNSVLLNFNAASEEMIFKQNGQMLAFAEPTLSQLDTVFLHDRKFVLYNKKFLEVLHQEGYSLFAQYKCRVIPPGKPAAYGGTSQTSSTDSYSSLSSGGRLYELKLPDDFQVKPYTIYFLDNGSGRKEIKTMRQLKGQYKKNGKQFDQYMKEKKVDFEDQQAVARLINFMETANH
ncbi:MAG: hypothetical protein PHQ77_08675 [Proteiniphilum sp.]|jgi:hypothetical protein|nr:hypothetical protein [Proteiniphilum sp.]